MKLGVVGDLSLSDPSRLTQVLDAALISCDLVVQVGDLAAAYTQVQSRIATSGHKLFCIPGNHDTSFDSLGVPRTWKFDSPDGLFTLFGLDNSTMSLSPDSKALFGAVGAPLSRTGKYEFVFAHMPPGPTMLPDGSENWHSMREGSQANPDADWLEATLKSRGADLLCCGHYHGWTLQFADWGLLLVDGRGGAAPDLAYTLITITPDGWVLHSVPA